MIIRPLKPCPFCVGHDLHIDRLGDRTRPFYTVRCAACEAEGPIARTEAMAVECWNTRPEPTDGNG